MATGGWRLAVVSGIAAGLALSPFLDAGEGPLRTTVVLVCLLVLTGLRSRPGTVGAVLIVCSALLVGLTAGNARLAAIDGDALRLDPGSRVSLVGYAETPPRVLTRGRRFLLDSTGAG